MSHPTVFISYSHDSREHADKVLDSADRLIADGVECVLDQYEESPAEGWPRWMDTNIKNADFVLMICTETYYKRVMGEEEPGKGRGVRWEGNLIYNHIYNADTKTSKFIPVLFDTGKTEHIPAPLQGATRYHIEIEQGYEDLYRRLTNQPRAEEPKLGKLKKLAGRVRRQDFFGPEVMSAKLPITGSELFGRERELGWLDEAWGSDGTHILSLVAWGGVGKTALVNYWLTHKMEPDDYRGAQRVYGWSFYSQGTSEERQASSDIFLVEALKWFGDEQMALSKEGPWQKGLRLGELVREHKTLLILDGVEPLQYPPGPMQGRLKDQGLQALLKQLAAVNQGLCIITTRQKIEDINPADGAGLKRVFLENLSKEAARYLLRDMGVKKGSDAELEEAAEQFGGHALALSLLGSYLATVHDGEIRKRDLIGRLTEEEEKGGHAKRVMASYELWLKDTPELDILYLMGLFDRPAPGGAIDALKAEPAIEGLTEKLQNLSNAKWKYAIKRLRDLRLLGQKDKSDLDTLDCHPLVREHFGQKLQQQDPSAWRQGHSRLYEYYKSVPEKELPDTLEEMQPLFVAVAHGCHVGLHQEALEDVYCDRICRKNIFFSIRQLGAFGSNLSALAGYFDELWSKPVTGLTADAKPFVLSLAGSALRAVGRLREAAQPMQAGMQGSIDEKDWKGAAQDANNLSELYLTLGEVKQAVDFAKRSVEYADHSEDAAQQYSKRTTLADTLHQAGDIANAEELFREAEKMQKQRQPAYPCLYSLWGFRFCDLLLSQGRYREVQERAQKALDIVLQGSRNLLDIALNTLSLGRACLLQAQEEGSGDFRRAADYLNQAVEGLRKAGQQDELPRGLLARAGLYRLQGDFSRARGDLAEAAEIAERGEMKLFMADYHLESARLCLAAGDKQKALPHLEKAEGLVEEMGYGRRVAEVEALKRAVEE